VLTVADVLHRGSLSPTFNYFALNVSYCLQHCLQ